MLLQKHRSSTGDEEVRKLGNLLKKKKKGMSEFLATIVCLGVLFTFVMAMIYAYGGILKEDNINRIHRKYLLSMEREGYLTPAYEAALRNELAMYGAINVDLSGTSNSPVGYGKKVILKIQCDIPVKSVKMTGGIVGTSSGGYKHVVVEKEATAFY